MRLTVKLLGCVLLSLVCLCAGQNNTRTSPTYKKHVIVTGKVDSQYTPQALTSSPTSRKLLAASGTPLFYTTIGTASSFSKVFFAQAQQREASTLAECSTPRTCPVQNIGNIFTDSFDTIVTDYVPTAVANNANCKKAFTNSWSPRYLTFPIFIWSNNYACPDSSFTCTATSCTCGTDGGGPPACDVTGLDTQCGTTTTTPGSYGDDGYDDTTPGTSTFNPGQCCKIQDIKVRLQYIPKGASSYVQCIGTVSAADIQTLQTLKYDTPFDSGIPADPNNPSAGNIYQCGPSSIQVIKAQFPACPDFPNNNGALGCATTSTSKIAVDFFVQMPNTPGNDAYDCAAGIGMTSSSMPQFTPAAAWEENGGFSSNEVDGTKGFYDGDGTGLNTADFAVDGSYGGQVGYLADIAAAFSLPASTTNGIGHHFQYALFANPTVAGSTGGRK